MPADAGIQLVPDFLDSRLKRAGMTRRKVINCRIRVQLPPRGFNLRMHGL